MAIRGKKTFEKLTIEEISYIAGFFDGEGMFDDQTVFSDYMAVLAGQGLYEQLYIWPRLKLNIAQGYRKVEALFSPAKWAMIVHDKTPVGMLDWLFRSNNTLK